MEKNKVLSTLFITIVMLFSCWQLYKKRQLAEKFNSLTIRMDYPTSVYLPVKQFERWHSILIQLQQADTLQIDRILLFYQIISEISEVKKKYGVPWLIKERNFTGSEDWRGYLFSASNEEMMKFVNARPCDRKLASNQ